MPTDGRHLYVVVMRDTAFWVVGPFPDKPSMTAWGEHELNNGDDPQWQSISLYPREVADPMPISWHPGYTP